MLIQSFWKIDTLKEKEDWKWLRTKNEDYESFLRKNRSMKLNIRTDALFEKPEYDDGGNEIGSQELVYALPSSRFNISTEDELTQALEDSFKQILLQIQNLEASASNLRFKQILSITIHYDKYMTQQEQGDI